MLLLVFLCCWFLSPRFLYAAVLDAAGFDAAGFFTLLVFYAAGFFMMLVLAAFVRICCCFLKFCVDLDHFDVNPDLM